MRRSYSSHMGFASQSSDSPGTANNHQLFELDRILTISTLKPEVTPNRPAQSSLIETSAFGLAFKAVLPASARELVEGTLATGSPLDGGPVEIVHVAHGGMKGSELLGVYLSNNWLIFRYVNDSGVPVIRQLPWFKEPSLRIMGLAFNHTAQWCMCVTTDVTVVLIPIYFLMLRRGNQSDSAENMVKVIKSASLGSAQKKRKVTNCLWWRSSTGQEYGIIASESGSLRFLNLISQECLRLKLKDPAFRMQIVQNGPKTATYLLMHGPQSAFHSRMLLEIKSGNQWKTIITLSAAPEFQPQQLTRFPRSAFKLRSQASDKGPILCSFKKQTNELQVFDASIEIATSSPTFPLFRYLISFDQSSQVQLVHIADHVMFVFSVDDSKGLSKITVVSRRLAETKTGASTAAASTSPTLSGHSSPLSNSASDGFVMLDTNPEAIMQEFYIKGADAVMGYLPPLPAAVMHSAHGGSNDTHDTNEMTVVEEGGYFWTKHSVYHIKPDRSPEEIFYSLVAAGLEKTKAEPLGVTFGLDLLRLYELAADAYFAEGQDARALEIYYLSEVSNTKLVSKFLQVGRINVIITRLRAALQRPRSLSINEKKKLSNQLFHCYLYKYLHERDVATPHHHAPDAQYHHNDEEFEKFLRFNEDYDSHQALLMLQQHGLMHLFSIVAHSRDLMARALNLMLAERGHGMLSPQHINYLQNNGYSEEMKTVAGGALMSALGGPNEQLRAYLNDFGTVYRYLNQIWYLLPELDAVHLELVCRYFDPLDVGPFIPEDERLEAGKPLEQLDTPMDCCDSPENVDSALVLRIFVTACMLLKSRKGKISPWPQIRGLQPSKVVQVACGYNHACAITEQGYVFSWGSNSKGQLGQRNPDLDYSPSPRRILGLSKCHITRLSCGGNHSLAVTDDGIVYVWGDNTFGQLAIGDREDRWVPEKLPENIFSIAKFGAIKSVSCGFFHTAVLTEMGVFTAGQGICGQLGHSNTNDSLVLKFVNGLPKATSLAKVCCGYSHTVVLTNAGELWAFGTNLYGQLGLGHNDDPVPDPHPITELGEKRILDVACGAFTTSALTSLGNILMWGRAASSKSSIPSDDPAFDVYKPKLVDPLHGALCESLASGPNHSLALTEKGALYVWGPAGRQMAQSRLVTTEPLSPGLLAEFAPGTVKQLACGDECNMILTSSGRLFVCGSAAYGKIGTGSTVDRKLPLAIFLDAVDHQIEAATSLATAIPNRTAEQATKPIIYESDDLICAVLRQHVPLNPGPARFLLPICRNMKQLLAAATVYEALGQHRAALEHRLLFIESTHNQEDEEKSILATEQLIHSLEHLSAAVHAEHQHQHQDQDQLGAPSASSPKIHREKMLYRLLEFWAKMKFPVAKLEEIILARPALQYLMGNILILIGRTNDPFAGLKCSPSFYLTIVQATLAHLKRHHAQSHAEHQATFERLWSKIKMNLEKDAEKRHRLIIPQVELRDHSKQRGAAAALAGDVAFTCGHIYTEKHFTDELIPELRERLANLPIPLPLTSKMILADYQLNFINLACPVCVYNYLRERHIAPGHPPAEKWIL